MDFSPVFLMKLCQIYVHYVAASIPNFILKFEIVIPRIFFDEYLILMVFLLLGLVRLWLLPPSGLLLLARLLGHCNNYQCAHFTPTNKGQFWVFLVFAAKTQKSHCDLYPSKGVVVRGYSSPLLFYLFKSLKPR